jgi:hypothetical protein
MKGDDFMSILKQKATVRKPVAEGNYELPLTKVQEFTNAQGGYVQLTFKNDDVEILHNIFGSNQKQIEYTIQTLGAQVGVYGERVSLDDVLIEGFIYKLYVSYNEYGRNVSFGVRKEQNTEEETNTENAF